MKNVADEDVRRLIESQHDVNIDGDTIAQNKHERASFDYTQGRLKAQRAALLVAVLAGRKESAETQAARAALAQAVKPAVAYYGFARSRTRAELLDLDPLAGAPDPVAHAQLAREWEDAFGAAPSSFERLGIEEQIARLDACCALISQSATLAAHPSAIQLRALVDAAKAALLKASKEAKDDTAAMTALRAARAAFDLADEAHDLQVRSILTGQGRIELLKLALRSEDPAYKARRAAASPITTDPLIDDLTPELPDEPVADA
jgi:DnaJ-domain-containing protein 1